MNFRGPKLDGEKQIHTKLCASLLPIRPSTHLLPFIYFCFPGFSFFSLTNMGPPTRKVIVRDTTGLPRTWVALQEDSQSKRWVELEPTYEFQKIESRTLAYATYQDKHDLEGPSYAVGDLLFAAPNLSPSTQELSHEEIPGFDICLTCEEVDMRSLLGRRSGMKYLLGPAESIISCKSCALCRIITASLEIDTGKSGQEFLSLASNCFVVLTSVPSAFPLQAGKERYHHIVAHLLHTTSAVSVGQASLRISASDCSKIGKTTLFGGRVVDPSNPDFNLASAWLADCDEHHDCLQSADQRSTIEQLLVIDVENACLVELPTSSKYLALSYVWPRFDVPKLMKNNFEDFRRSGHFLDMHHQLPRVVRDAIEVVRELGEVYLWIDALCIVQDDKDKKDQLIKQMDRVYGDSYLTIVVASSTSPEEDYAIPGLGSPRRNRQETQQWDGVGLMTAFPDYNSAIERSRWATRGWTFQEGVLSRRCLVFAEDQMYFRCTRDSRCEDVVTETGTDHYEVHPAKPKFRESKIDYLISSEFLKSMSGEDTFSEYARLVRDYTKRSLTFEFDVLPAFTGIMNTLLPHFHEQAFVAGLLCFSFDRALLWYHTSPARRRQIFACDHGTHDHHCYPSWSWA